METIGFIGLGKIRLPICQHLITKGFRVIGYRQSSLADRESTRWKACSVSSRYRQPIGPDFTCLLPDEAFEDVIAGPQGLITVARPNQIAVECRTGQT